MNFTDVMKKSVLEKFQAGDLSTASIAVTLGMAILAGLFIYLVYRINTKSGFYNRDFNKSLAILPVITSAIMLAMSSNLAIGLGMVGALSIVRFRNAVKAPIDLTYLFWSISMGIVTGAGLFELAVIASLALTALLFALDLVPSFRAPCLLIVSGKEITTEPTLMAIAKEHSHSVKVRSRNISKTGVEWILEMRLRNEKDFLQKIAAVDNVTSVHLMTHDGDVRF